MTVIDARICEKCPVGPEPLGSRFCQRCVTDVAGIAARDAFVGSLTSLHYDGVDYRPAVAYDLLPNFLPAGDPASEPT